MVDRGTNAEHHVAGVSIAVIRDAKIVWAKGYGIADVEPKQPVTTPTLFQAASISKPVAATGALVLVEGGQLTLDADINPSLKTWKVPANAHTARAPVTLDGLLSHTAGLTVHGFPGYAAGTPYRGAAGPRRHAASEHGGGACGPRSGHALPLLGWRLHHRAARDDGRDGQPFPTPERGSCLPRSA